MNLCILTGRTTKDIELRHGDKTAIGRFTLANDAGKDKTNFVDCTVFGDAAERMEKWVTKGKKILIRGRLNQESWDDKETGKKRSALKVIVDTWEFAEGKSDSAPAEPPKTDKDGFMDIDDGIQAELPFL